ncbi:host attachment protein [Tateyamaria omphalii]|uniref:host attachment family protein n=1 Tax=Tateyamaria omphalii TaxID=299262 RepID=UPI0016725904|nr:host attachment family protein [Tateyamaria omphalii]GGX68787.1 host attachment protein [Tateyamaria omphalii]
MAKLDRGTLVVVADGEKALFLRNLKGQRAPNFAVTDVEAQENPPSRAQSTDRPGRMKDGGPGQSSALEDTDWHTLAKDRFAKDLSSMLYAEAHKGTFDKLVLVASPQVLGVLRAEMHMEVTTRIVADIPKTLTNHTVHEIEKIVTAELGLF